MHPLVGRNTATSTGSVSSYWLGKLFNGLPADASRMRENRSLEEAADDGADRFTWPTCSPYSPKRACATPRSTHVKPHQSWRLIPRASLQDRNKAASRPAILGRVPKYEVAWARRSAVVVGMAPK